MRSFLAIFAACVKERLRISTALGHLNNFADILADLHLTHVPVIDGYVVTDPASVLHHSCVTWHQVDSQTVTADLISPDYVAMGLMVEALLSSLPADVVMEAATL